MARRIAVQTLNASTLDIINVIRQNASYDYQQNVPFVKQASDIPKVGEIIYGTPAFANQFINALVNRIALVRAKSATFNNPYAHLKKGYLEFGETIEEIFVGIAKVYEYNAEKASSREFKRNLPDVRTAFHAMNWRVIYPVTIQDEDLRLAFLSIDGVTNLIATIVDGIYTAAEYDEYLLFKYLLIKAIAKGKMYPVGIEDTTDLKNAAVEFRAYSNMLPFMRNEFNEAGVKNNTPRDRQAIFMDARFNARFDVEVLASAFNMDKTDFMGRLHLIDDWTSFDNERFEIIRENSDGLEDVTADELELMKGVFGVLVDEDWFQVYDNNNKFTEKYVAAGLYWNYFYHVWKTISTSPFSNALVFVDAVSEGFDSTDIPFIIAGKEVSEDATVLHMILDVENLPTNKISNIEHYEFVQTDELTALGVAVTKYGAFMIPKNVIEFTPVVRFNETDYTATEKIVVETVATGNSVIFE